MEGSGHRARCIDDALGRPYGAGRGENADGPSLDHDAFDIAPAAELATSDAPQQVLDAILGTRESAAEEAIG